MLSYRLCWRIPFSNLFLKQQCSPQTVSLSTISFVISDAACVKRVALKNGLVQSFLLIFIGVAINTSTFSQKRSPKKKLLWKPIFSQPAFYLFPFVNLFSHQCFFVRMTGLKWITHTLAARTPTFLFISPHFILTVHQPVFSPIFFAFLARLKWVRNLSNRKVANEIPDNEASLREGSINRKRSYWLSNILYTIMA